MADIPNDELRVRLQNLEAKQKTFFNGLGLPILLGLCASVVLFSGWLGAAEKVRWIPLICIFLVIANFITILLRWHAQYVELQVLRRLSGNSVIWADILK